MTVDHVGTAFDAAHMHADSAARWVVGSPLPPAEFLTRWVTHLCAPVFVLLAGVSLALSAEKRKGQPGQTRFIVTRGLFIAALDPLWMSLGFANYARIIAAVLYALGLSMVCMAFLRRLSSKALLVGALAIQLFGELADAWHPEVQPLKALWGYLFIGGPTFWKAVCPYPLIPWLSIMMAGWVLGRWWLEPREQAQRVRTFALLGVSLLGVFAVVRGLNGYGNWNLLRDSADVLQWLHVAKYPPSLSYTTLELGLGFLLLALFTALDDPGKPRVALAPLMLFGSTAFFYYLWHVHLAAGTQLLFGFDKTAYGLEKTWLGSLALLLVLAWPTWRYRKYKAAHPDGWARYV